MINLKNNKNQKINRAKFVEILFYTFPLSFIIGNLILSIHLLLFIVTSLLFINKNRLSFRFDNSYWLLIIFFSYLFLSTAIQFQNNELLNEKIQNWSSKDNPIFKSFILVRFLILIFIIDTLFFNKILFLFSLICTTFVSIDIIFQYITSFDLLGNKGFEKWNSGPFGDERIAGSYLKNFSFLSFFYIFVKVKNKNSINLLLIFFIPLHLLGTLLSGNRMPLILFLFGCVLIILLIKNLRLIMSLSLIIFLSIFSILSKNDENIRNSYGSFFAEINILKLIKTKTVNISNEKREVKKNEEVYIEEKDNIKEGIILLDNTNYGRIYRTSMLMWKEKPFLGFGLKSFRIKCFDILDRDAIKIGKPLFSYPEKDVILPGKLACGNHSHNYYFELLSETGLIGTTLLIIFFLILLKDSFYCIKKYTKETDSKMILLLPFILGLILEIWPLRSSGSFFTTWNATYFWLNVAILFTLRAKKNILS